MKLKVNASLLFDNPFRVVVFLLLLVASVVFTESRSVANFSTETPGHEGLRIELTGNGFEPGQIQTAAGTFEIQVENSALPGEYTLLLKSQDGAVVKELQVQKGSAAWTVTLQTGQYSLIEAGHPQWQCQLTVQ